VKIDPLAMVQAIERYLVVRGYGGIRADSDDDSEEDMDDNVAAVVMTQAGFKHKLQFTIGDHVLPYNMTVYQAVKQFSPLVSEQPETDNESETLLGNASIWVQQHTIYYRPVEEEVDGAIEIRNNLACALNEQKSEVEQRKRGAQESASQLQEENSSSCDSPPATKRARNGNDSSSGSDSNSSRERGHI